MLENARGVGGLQRWAHNVINLDLLLCMGRVVGLWLGHMRRENMNSIISPMTANTKSNAKLLNYMSLAMIEFCTRVRGHLCQV